LQIVATAKVTADSSTDVVNGTSLGTTLLAIKLVEVESDFLEETVDVEADIVSTLRDLFRNGHRFVWRRSELTLDD
jgi:hypothetical protein